MSDQTPDARLTVINDYENTMAILPAVNVQIALQRYQDMKDFISKVMHVNVDFGKIPGTTKDTLLKPGAEKLSWYFALRPIFNTVSCIEDWTGRDHDGEPFFYYRETCTLYHHGEIVVQAEGSCNSWEKKYRYRDAQRKCPKCGKETIIKGKEEYGGGWLCFLKKGGCGAKFSDGDQQIEGQHVGQIKNTETADLPNTILKMADKRALVAAVLIGANASEWFTQDMEDFVDGSFVDAGTGEVRQPAQPAQNRPAGNPPAQANPPAQQRRPAQTAGSVAQGMMATIGKNKYPVAWGGALMPATVAAGRCNQFELDGILQKLITAKEIDFKFDPAVVVEAVGIYLDGKASGVEDPMVDVHGYLEAYQTGATENG